MQLLSKKPVLEFEYLEVSFFTFQPFGRKREREREGRENEGR